MNIRYLGFKDQLDIPEESVKDINLENYLLHLSHIDGVFSALEDYFDITNPRIQSLFPKSSFNPLPFIKPTPIVKDEQYLLVFRSFSLAQKMSTLSNFSENLLANWYVDSTFTDPWGDESSWIFEQDLADILISLMQNLGTEYRDSPDDSLKILAVLNGAKISFSDSYNSLKVARIKLDLPDSSIFRYWMSLQDYSFEAYLQAIEYLIDFFTYCDLKKSLPTVNSLLNNGF